MTVNAFPIRLISFGYLHGPSPDADIVIDVRTSLRDPAAAQAIVDLDGRDRRVQDVVLNTHRAMNTLWNLADLASSNTTTDADDPGETWSLAIGCAGGHHRSVALIELLARHLRELGVVVHVEHRHVHLPRVMH